MIALSKGWEGMKWWRRFGFMREKMKAWGTAECLITFQLLSTSADEMVAIMENKAEVLKLLYNS